MAPFSSIKRGPSSTPQHPIPHTSLSVWWPWLCARGQLLQTVSETSSPLTWWRWSCRRSFPCRSSGRWRSGPRLHTARCHPCWWWLRWAARSGSHAGRCWGSPPGNGTSPATLPCCETDPEVLLTSSMLEEQQSALPAQRGRQVALTVTHEAPDKAEGSMHTSRQWNVTDRAAELQRAH